MQQHYMHQKDSSNTEALPDTSRSRMVLAQGVDDPIAGGSSGHHGRSQWWTPSISAVQHDAGSYIHGPFNYGGKKGD